VWPRSGKEPLVDVDRAVLITVHHQATVLVGTAIRPLPQRHVPLVLAHMTHLGGIALTYYMQFFPKAHTLVRKHVHKAIKPPTIIHHAVAHAALLALFGGLLLVFLDDHLPLGKIANHHSSFSQSVCDEMRSFMQRVALFVAFAFRDAAIHLGEMDVAARLLLTAVALGTKLVELSVVPAVALEPADVVEASLVGVARRQGVE
jgi:hypothetical protein